METFNVTLVKSLVANKPYCKVDGRYAGPTWKNNIGLQKVGYNIEAVHELCLRLATDPMVCMVYGTAIKEVISNTNRTMQNFEEQPTYLLTLDLDSYQGGLKDVYPAYKDCIKESDHFINKHLPPEFSGVSYILRFSSSFLTKDTKFKTHIVFLLADSQFPREIGTWIKRQNIPTDPTFYLNLTQPVFTAGPQWKDKVDPLEKIDGYFPRVSLVKKAVDLVPTGWQPYVVPKRDRSQATSELPKAEELLGKVGSFCRMVPIEKAMIEVGYSDHGEGRYLAPTSDTGLPGAMAFTNGYCFSHHSGDPINEVVDKMYDHKRSSLNSYDLMYGWAELSRSKEPELMSQFQYLLSEATIQDHVYQEELTKELIFRTEWLLEQGYAGDNKVIIDQLLIDISQMGLSELSRNYIFDVIKVKGKVKVSELKSAWKALRKDSAYYKNEYDPEAGLRHMAKIFLNKKLLYSHHHSLRGDFWCYYGGKSLWKRRNADQTHAFIYRHLHEALPLKQEIEIHKVDNLTRLILKIACENGGKFVSGKGWAFKGGVTGIMMDAMFSKEPWTVEQNIRSLRKEHHVTKELPVTLNEWRAIDTMPDRFFDFLVASCEEDYEKVDLLQEFIGYIFADAYPIHNFLIIEGVPGSGKSILIKIIRECLGSQYFVAVSLNRMGTQFGLGDLPGKKLAVMSEAREINFTQMKAALPIILKMVGNDPIDIEAKHKVATTEVLESKLMVITNRTPVMPDDTGALTQRMILLRLNKSFRGTDEEVLGLDDLILDNEIPHILKWAFEGLERLSMRKAFNLPESVRKESAMFRRQIDPLKTYIEEWFDFDPTADSRLWIQSTRFINHFQEYLYRIGQQIDRNRVMKRASINILRTLFKTIHRTKVRDGEVTYSAIEPLVPRTDLVIEFAEERNEMKANEGK